MNSHTKYSYRLAHGTPNSSLGIKCFSELDLETSYTHIHGQYYKRLRLLFFSLNKTFMPGSHPQTSLFNWYGMWPGIWIFESSLSDSNMQQRLGTAVNWRPCLGNDTVRMQHLGGNQCEEIQSPYKEIRKEIREKFWGAQISVSSYPWDIPVLPKVASIRKIYPLLN